MTEISLRTFSDGRVEMKTKAGSRLRPAGLVVEDFGLASVKQTFLPSGDAV